MKYFISRNGVFIHWNPGALGDMNLKFTRQAIDVISVYVFLQYISICISACPGLATNDIFEMLINEGKAGRWR